MKDVMIDLEALGNSKSKCICQIGAVYFDNTTGELGETFQINVDAQTHQKLGGEFDAETIYWWLAQSDEARKSLLDNRKSVTESMLLLDEFLKKASRIWSHATYDFVTIMETYKQINIKPSFNYKNGLDIRTLVYLSGITMDKLTRDGTHHNALDDAKYQVKYCVKALNILKTNKNAIRLLEQLVSKE